MFVALFTMGTMAVYADVTLDLAGDNFSNWGDGERTINADGSVTLTFTGAWGGAGWTYWGENLDLTQYAELCVVFKDNTTGGTVQVFLGDATDDYNSCTPAASSEVEGKLVFYIQNADVNCDLSKIGQLMIQTSAAGSVTIESITLMDEAVVDDEVIDIANGDKTAWNADSTDNITVNEDGTVTLKFVSEGDGGLGWTNWWPTWDASSYNYIVLKYKDLTSDTEGAYIQLYVGTSPEAVVVADEAVSGQIVVALADYPDYDFSSIGQIVIQGSAPLSVTVESLYFTTSLGGDEVTAYFDSSSVDWDPVYCYVFGANDPWPVITDPWPGEECEYLGDNIWKWTYKGSEEAVDWKIIFCNETGSSQTSPDFIFYNGGLYNTDGYVGQYGEESGDDLKFECDGLYYEVLVETEEEYDDDGNLVSSTDVVTDNVQIISPEAYEEGLGVYTITKLNIPATATNGDKTYNVTRIGTEAFARSAVEDLVTIPANIVSTGTSSFDSCNGIIRVTFEEGEDLYDDNDSNGAGGWMFGNCPHIDIVHLNRDIYCGSNTRLCAPFTYTSSITTIYIGENVTRIPAYMFRNTSTKCLKTVTSYAMTPPDWRYDPFSNIGDDGAILYVHQDAIEAYESAEGTDGVAWASLFSQILPIEGVEEGITNVETETSAKVTGIYNLAGQRVNENAKGIVIKDGKKVLVK